MAQRKKLTKGVLCRDGKDWCRHRGDHCIAFFPDAVCADGEQDGNCGCWRWRDDATVDRRKLVSWTRPAFSLRYPKVRIPTRGTCRETSLLI